MAQASCNVNDELHCCQEPAKFDEIMLAYVDISIRDKIPTIVQTTFSIFLLRFRRIFFLGDYLTIFQYWVLFDPAIRHMEIFFDILWGIHNWCNDVKETVSFFHIYIYMKKGTASLTSLHQSFIFHGVSDTISSLQLLPQWTMDLIARNPYHCRT